MLRLKCFGKEFNICNDWNEVTFGQYIDVLYIKENVEFHIERARKLFAAISDNPKELEKCINKFSEEEFSQLNNSFDFNAPDFKNYTATTATFFIDGKEYKIKDDYNRLTMGEMDFIEKIKAHSKNTLNDNEIAFGVIIREVDEQGNEKEFEDTVAFEVIHKLRDKVFLRDIYDHLTFFLLGKKPPTPPTEVFSIHPI
jgi:hypothetical protein